MTKQEAKRLEELADQAYRLLVGNVARAKQLTILCRQAQRVDSSTTEQGINARTQETITGILSTVHSFRALSRECLTIYNRDNQVTWGDGPEAA
jgi:hypothetical protein